VEVNIEASVGSAGDSYDNALAETINGLYKTDLFGIAARGEISTMGSLRPWNGSIGLTIAGYWSRSEISRQQNLKWSYYRQLRGVANEV